MKEYFKNFTNLLLICVVVILLISRSCNPKSPPETIVQTEVVTRYDTIYSESIVYKPIYKDRIEYDIDTFSFPIDTNAILRDYYAEYVYEDTLEIDSFGYILINDTISRNQIQSRQYISNILIPTTTITNTIFENKREFYIGIESGVNTKGEINFVGTDLLFKTKKKQVYGVGIGIDRNFNPTIMGSMYWKIGRK